MEVVRAHASLEGGALHNELLLATATSLVVLLVAMVFVVSRSGEYEDPRTGRVPLRSA